MYPGTATQKEIIPSKTTALEFKSGLFIKMAQVSPAANICETITEYRIALAAPGLHKEDFCIDISHGILSISVRNEKQPLCCIYDRTEYDYTDWTRAFILPVDADAVLAHSKYHRGELLIRIPRGNTNENKVTAKVYVY